MPALPSNTKLWIPFNEDFNDNAGGHTVTNVGGNAVISTTTKYFGAGSGFFDETANAYLTIPDSTDWDFYASLASSWTISFFIKMDTHAGNDDIFTQYEDGSNLGYMRHIHGTGLDWVLLGASSSFEISGGEITDSNWHHVAFIKVGGSPAKYAIYKDGTQVAYGTSTIVDSFAGIIAIAGNGGNHVDGYLDDFLICNSNPFGANPDAGLTDTIEVPTAEWGEIEINVYESISVAENISAFINPYHISVSESISISEDVSVNSYFVSEINIFETISVSEGLTVENENLGGINVYEELAVSENLSMNPISFISVVDTLSVTESISTDFILTINVYESIIIQENLGTINEYSINVYESITVQESNEFYIPLEINKYDSVSITESVSVNKVWDEPLNIVGRVIESTVSGRILNKY